MTVTHLETPVDRDEQLLRVAGRVARCVLVGGTDDARALLSDLYDADIWEVALVLAGMVDPLLLPPDDVDRVAVHRLVRGEHPQIVHRVDLIAAIDILAARGWTIVDIVSHLQGAGGLQITKRAVGDRVRLLREAA